MGKVGDCLLENGRLLATCHCRVVSLTHCPVLPSHIAVVIDPRIEEALPHRGIGRALLGKVTGGTDIIRDSIVLALRFFQLALRPGG